MPLINRVADIENSPGNPAGRIPTVGGKMQEGEVSGKETPAVPAPVVSASPVPGAQLNPPNVKNQQTGGKARAPTKTIEQVMFIFVVL
jgi:hypothetical protein